jgi:hypothetical protein
MLSEHYTIITIWIRFTLNLQKGKVTLTEITCKY